MSKTTKVLAVIIAVLVAIMVIAGVIFFTRSSTQRKLKDIESELEQFDSPEDMEQAHYINDMYVAGRDTELPYEGMMLTTMVAEAARMVRLENGPENFNLRVSAFALGGLAFCGIPGEPFTGIGRGLKEAEGWDLVCPICLTNGGEGYFPMQEAYDEGGYEARSSAFKAGVAELLIKEGTALMQSLKGE